jgi:putative membrane protein
MNINITINTIKMIPTFKQPLLITTFITTMLFSVSCKDSQKAEDSKVLPEEQNEAKFNNNDHANDAQFLVNASEMNLEAIQLGQLAQQRSTSTHVKELGTSMMEVHTVSQRNLATMAKSKTISIPTSPTHDARDAHNKLNRNSGQDFDQAYANLMVNKHKDAIAIFEKASRNSNDTQIQNWATTTLRDLRKHLDHALETQKKLEQQ